ELTALFAWPETVGDDGAVRLRAAVNHQAVLGRERDTLVEVWCDARAHRHNKYAAAYDRQNQPGDKHDCQGFHQQWSHRPSSSCAQPYCRYREHDDAHRPCSVRADEVAA